MSGHAGSKKDYLPVFEGFPEVTGFFSLKSGAVEGSPYDNQAVFRQLDVENAVRVFPKQIHKKHAVHWDIMAFFGKACTFYPFQMREA